MTNKNHLTVVTYNIQFGINSEKIIANIETLAKDGANIICLQEIINIHNEIFIIEKILKRLGSKWKASYHVGKEISKLSIGTAIFWNSEILTFKHEEKILLPKIKKFDFHEKFFYKIVGEKAITLQRKALSCYFGINQTELRVTCVHIDNIGGPSHRMKQIIYLITKLKEMKNPQSEIICGDFNTFDLLKTNYERKQLQKNFGKDFVDASKKIDWTSDIYMADYPNSNKLIPWLIKTFNIHIRRRLDYIWVKNMKVISCKKRELSGSDHFPVVAELEL